MKVAQKDSVVWDQIQMRSPSGNALLPGSVTRPVPKLMVWLILFISVTYVIYTLKLLSSSSHTICDDSPFSSTTAAVNPHISLPLLSNTNTTTTTLPTPLIQDQTVQIRNQTEIHHIVFGIAASAKLWQKRKEYIKIWYRPRKMRGVVWLDDRVKSAADDRFSLPPVRISKDTSNFPYTNRQGHRSAIRISRIVSETLHLKQEGVRWFVMGDDDTVFLTENLVRILNKYDHNQYWYIGSSSESHLQNIYFSYGMAYGGGGFAISYPLAKALAKMQDRCIKRYPGLYGSDDRMQACMAELGVPLTRELGFHQYDVYGNLFGLLASHPVAPLVSLHHLDVVEPIFPNVTRVQALKHLMLPAKVDSAGLMQQSICYHPTNRWTISVSWGFAVQVFRGIFSPREMEMPSRTFLNWYRRADYTAYAFNTRPVSRNPCQKPFVFYMSNVKSDGESNQTVSKYARHRDPQPPCKWKMSNPAKLDTVVVYKTPDPLLWNRSPRRNCCRVMESYKKGTMVVEVGMCKDGEVSEV